MARASAAHEVVTCERIESASQQDEALAVVDEVYVSEKGWMEETKLDAFPYGSAISWYLARVNGEPAGLMRLLYDPPLDFPSEYDVQLNSDVDWLAVARQARIVEVGRLMVRDRFRSQTRVVMRLMSAAVNEVVQRDYTHLLTDVFEGDPHSPLNFHTRVIGFQRIGTHTHGEMKTQRKRIILALDIDQAYLKMRARGGRVFQEFTEGVRHLLEARVNRRAAAPDR